jgi:putative transposase
VKTESSIFLKKAYRGWVEEGLEKQGRQLRPKWTESIAVGSEDFVRDTKEKLGIRAIGREIVEAKGSYVLREPEGGYEGNFDTENVGLSEENMYYWDESNSESTS